jgi:serine/threonine protein kinase
VTRERAQEIERLLHAALALPARTRAPFLSAACRDGDLRREIEARLEQATNVATSETAAGSPMAGQRIGLVGQRMGAYEVREVLGTGAMGIVYLAHDPRLDRGVAIKVLSPDLTLNDAAKRRFLREAKNVSALDHPNICTIYEINETSDGQLYLVMARYDGGPLSQRIARGPLPTAEAVDLALQVGRGLERAHAAGIIHRDIKPGNLMLTSDGVVKIVDFGIAKLVGSEALTAEGTALGTVAYMAPEQLRGEPADARADIWALGVVLYEMLAGQRPFRGDSLAATAAAVLTSTPRPLKEFRDDIPRQLLATIAGCLEKPRATRYATAGVAVASLRQVQEAKGVESTSTLAARPSIAVLPFADLSPAQDQGYLCEGIAEEIITALAGVRGLRVVSRTSAFQARAKGFDLTEIGERLRVDTVLEGSVRRVGRQLRVTAQLVDIGDASPVWSTRYDREVDDIFEVQDEIAQAVASTLRGQLLAGNQRPLVKRATASLQAYIAYMRGRHYRYSRYQSPMASRYFEEAVRHDPTYAAAWAGLGQTAIMSGFLLVQPHQEASAKARAAIDRALTLDKDLSEAYDARARIRFWFDFDWDSADKDFQHAIELDPVNVDAYAGYASFLGFMGRLDAALAQVALAQEIDPLSAHAHITAAIALLIGRRYEDAIEACRHALEIQPDSALALSYLSFSYQACARYDEALACLQKVPEGAHGTMYQGFLGQALALAGHRDEARKILAELTDRSARDFVGPSALAHVCVGLGEFEDCVVHMTKVIEDHGSGFVFLQFPTFDALREEPRMKALREKIKLPTPPPPP